MRFEDTPEYRQYTISLCKRLKQIRFEKKLEPKQVAELTGISLSLLKKIEAFAAHPDQYKPLKISSFVVYNYCKALGVNYDSLLPSLKEGELTTPNIVADISRDLQLMSEEKLETVRKLVSYLVS